MFAVIQTMLTSLPAGRPAPLSENAVPARAMSGVVFRTVMFSDVFMAAATGPGSPGTPAIAGAGTGGGAATAAAGRSSEPATAAPVSASLRLQEAVVLTRVFMFPF